MSKLYLVPAAVTLFMMALPVQAQFTDDEFNSPSLNPQWTFVDSTTVGSTYTLTGTELQLQSPADTDYYFFVDNYGSIETTAPLGDNWEIITKINNWDPTATGQQRHFARAGIQIWQDNNHYINAGLLSNNTGLQIGTQSFSNFNPVAGNNGFYEDGTDIGNTGVQSAYLIRIQKTENRYVAAYSIDDGATWTTMSGIVRNPETADGYFTNEKIRLFTTGGFEGGAVTPAKFDYVHVNTLPPPASHAYADDEFDGPTLNPQWRSYSGVLEGFTFFDTGKFKITAGPNSDLWIGKSQAAYIYQNAPTSASYDLTIKCGPTEFTAVGYELFNSYGIWLWHDSGNWAFISNQRGDVEGPPGTFTPNNRIEYASKHNGIFSSGVIPFGTTTSDVCPEYLRISKDGSLASLSYSFDDVTYTPVVHPTDGPTFDIGSDDLEVRLFSKRVFADGAPMEAEFDWIHSVDTGSSDVSDWQLY